MPFFPQSTKSSRPTAEATKIAQGCSPWPEEFFVSQILKILLELTRSLELSVSSAQLTAFMLSGLVNFINGVKYFASVYLCIISGAGEL